jgi:transposase
MLKTMSYRAIGKKYGVSDTAIRRWINLYHKTNILDKII